MATVTHNPTNYIAVPLGCPPGREGEITIPVDFDFSAGADHVADFSALESKGVIANVQSFYIDNLANPQAVSVTDPTTQQTITIPALSQAYMPLLSKAPNQLNISGTGTATVTINFNNFYMPPYIWGTSP
jgi:hypothetical protein